ncbi:S8 family serine peptidase [Actinoplanes sp. ATCC 53533]|uniref:S8 family peptidase n=1 Tax=Actinoplanes sp. ATCC 53533 TaxID=1288362 RepID=UPI001315484E|nr:S8 family serine peptidase [Actinoplanes sp. ATCC 53533]
MKKSMRQLGRVTAVGASLSLVVAGAGLALVAPGANSAYGAEPQGAAPISVRGGSYAVTLITGDTVHVQSGRTGKPNIRFVPGKNRKRVSYATYETPQGLTVLPADAVRPLAAGTLDPRLFNVTLLHKWGYDDARTKTLPLMIIGSGATLKAPAALAGSTAVRSVPTLRLTSLRQRKADAGSFWASLTAPVKSAAAAAVAKVWAVGKLQPALDVSVPQIGAPTAWAAGYTGKGVTVGVVDTGVDGTHPDLKDVVVDAKDFTGTGLTDEVGHGTHVAGTIAGRGTASGGKYTGVAKQAHIKSAKVCEPGGCAEDAILAGMAWAAESGAKVINMSLGGPVGDTVDLMRDTVDTLTASKKVLFVIAAGNDGTPETIGSPGTADSAVTVGSIDKGTDNLSEFSSEGPRVNASRRLDYAIKPDITAPGGGITAPYPGGGYETMSGTSMATPHVAGSAAILAGQHPDWTPSELKRALMSTAKKLDGQTVYQQGAGRLDLGRASTQHITATGSLSLGYFPWPHEGTPSATQKIAYANAGSTPVTLALSMSVNQVNGTKAAAGMFSLGANSVTVPAGGTVEVPVTVKPAAGAIGLYTGYVAAKSLGGAAVLSTAIGAYKELASYNVSYTEFGRGTAAHDTFALLINKKTGAVNFDYVRGLATRRVPAGDYMFIGMVVEPDGTSSSYAIDAQPVTVKAPTDIRIDARAAKPVTLDFDAPADAEESDHALSATFGDVTLGAMSATGLYGMPRPPAAGLDWGYFATLVKRGSSTQKPTPYTFNLALRSKGMLPPTQRFATRRADLAKVQFKINHAGQGEARNLFHSAALPNATGYGGVSIPAGDLYSRIDYMSTVPGSTFQSQLESLAAADNSSVLTLTGLSTAYRKDTTSTVQLNEPVFGPSWKTGGIYTSASRQGDMLNVDLPLLSTSAQSGFASKFIVTPSWELSQGGKVIATSDDPWFYRPVPAGRATYTLRGSVKNDKPWTPLSPEVAATWTFTSEHQAEDKDVPLALQAVRFSPRVDRDNKAKAGPTTIPLVVQRSPDTGAPSVASITAQVSFDGGKTWSAAPLEGAGATRTMRVTNPAGGTVSLRVTVADAAGSTVEQTIKAAYTVR